jgi:hypothetical protein
MGVSCVGAVLQGRPARLLCLLVQLAGHVCDLQPLACHRQGWGRSVAEQLCVTRVFA